VEEGAEAGYLITCQHPNVYTLGKSGKASNLLVDQNFLDRINATFYKIDRGGDVTYHGPGQLVVYPILDLERIGISLREYIYMAEQSVIDTIAEWGVVGERSEGATGVWIAAGGGRPLRKICAVGVRSSHWVTMHGLGFNISTDLRYFGYINPCGFTDRGVTSLSAEVGRPIEVSEVESVLLRHLEKNINIKIIK
jgi:lipoyl(octanoyl) transferase